MRTTPEKIRLHMTMKKPVAFLAFVGACALAVTGPATLAAPPTLADTHPATGATASSLPVGDIDTALTSKSGQTSQPDQVAPAAEQDSSRIVGIIVQLHEGSDRVAALTSINEAVAAAFPGESAQVQREYDKALEGFALRAPAGSLDAIRAVRGVKTAFLERETRISDVDEVDAEGGTQAPRLSTQHPDNLSAQIMMRADQLTHKNKDKVVAVIDTGVEMTHPAFSGALASTPALTADKVEHLIPQLGEGKRGVYI